MKKGFYDRLIDVKDKYGDLLIICDDSEKLDAAGLLSGADSFCERLLSMGVKENDHVALCAGNSCTWLKAFLGIIKCGAVAVLMNSMLSTDELAELSTGMDSGFFLYGKCSAAEKDPDFIDAIQPNGKKRLDIDSVICKNETDFSRQNLSIEDLKKPAFIIFTSGSTGKPKGSMISQLCNINGADALTEHIPQMTGESLCIALPLFHIFGLSLSMAHILNGGRLIIPTNSSAEAIIRAADTYKPDAIAGVMRVLTNLTAHRDFELSAAPHCVQRLYTGGGMLMPIQLLRTEHEFDKAKLLNCYGQSESDSGISMTTPDDDFDRRVSSVGRALNYRTVAVMDSNGSICGPGTSGEVVVKASENITCGYYKLSEEKQPVQNGWLHTGDIGYFDSDGYLHLSGRIKDIIIKGGENINPNTIETEISRIAGVRDVKVMGAPNELYGESIEACVSLDEGCDIDESDLKAAVRNSVPSFSQPSHFFIFDSFPLKANGKLDTCELKVRMLSRLNKRIIDDEMNKGITVLSLSAKSQHYMIAPICRSCYEIITNFGFTREKAGRIRLCLEELLTERTNPAYYISGDLNVEFRLYSDYMRIRFWDEKTEGFLSENTVDAERSISTKIILGFTDRLSREKRPDGTVCYCLDYIYDRDYEASSFFSG